MAQQGRAFGIVERALVGLADRGAGGRNDHGFSHCYAFGRCAVDCASKDIQLCCAYRIR